MDGSWSACRARQLARSANVVGPSKTSTGRPTLQPHHPSILIDTHTGHYATTSTTSYAYSAPTRSTTASAAAVPPGDDGWGRRGPNILDVPAELIVYVGARDKRGVQHRRRNSECSSLIWNGAVEVDLREASLAGCRTLTTLCDLCSDPASASEW